MSSRAPIMIMIGLFISGAGAWWLFSDRGTQEDSGVIAAAAPAATTATEGGPAATLQPALASAEAGIEGPSPEAVPGHTESSNDNTWPAGVLEFAEQADPDPALSRALETSMHMAVDATLDRGKHELHSVTCRGANCQILSINRSTETGNPWATTVAAVLRDLGSRPVLNPSTGAELKPGVQMVRAGRGEAVGNVAVIGFQ